MITLEKIDAVMAATGAAYPEVRETLIACDGDVGRAVRVLTGQEPLPSAETAEEEESKEPKADPAGASREKMRNSLDDVLDVIRELWRTGNASSLIIEKNGETLLNLSLTVSVFALIIAPVIAVIGIGAAFITEYTIKVVMDNGEVINVLSYNLKHQGERKQYRKHATQETAEEPVDAAGTTPDAEEATAEPATAGDETAAEEAAAEEAAAEEKPES
ncbi:MAG: DUF4342 domain-containing protein [Bacillota bacterium]|nr:DUF4342 domain-containing protein [Bacillota bacterium]